MFKLLKCEIPDLAAEVQTARRRYVDEKWPLLIVALVALLFLITASMAKAQGIDAGRYVALLVGNNKYENVQDLNTAISDVRAMSDLLQSKYGFEVTLLENGTRRQILGAINRLRGELGPDDNLLIYYAGHGTLDRQSRTGYWLPVDAEPDSDINWISNEAITRYLRSMLARHVMVIADSCFSGTLVRASRTELAIPLGRQEWLKRMAEKRSRTALVSGGLEPVEDSGRAGHSVFANALLSALKSNNEPIDGQSLFRIIRHPVVVNADQTPQYSDIRRADHEGGDFVFIPKLSTAKASREPATGRSPARDTMIQVELAFWQSVSDSQSPAMLQTYLDRYPEGTFAPVARLRLQELKRQQLVASQTSAVPTSETKSASLVGNSLDAPPPASAEQKVAILPNPQPTPLKSDSDTASDENWSKFKGAWSGDSPLCSDIGGGSGGIRVDFEVDEDGNARADIWRMTFTGSNEMVESVDGSIVRYGTLLFPVFSLSVDIEIVFDEDADGGIARIQQFRRNTLAAAQDQALCTFKVSR
jgi:hypothetical protein